MVAKLPLRLGIIGLSGNAATSWASNAHLPGLLKAHGKELYKISALCNSSVEAAKQAIKFYKLPTDTKAYGTPQDLANDKEIDVVICAVRVDKHYETILPSIQAGKAAYIEWPIAANQQEIHELVQAAKSSGSKVAIGIQGRWVPPVHKIKDIIQSGKLGKVLSSDISAYGGTINRASFPSGLKYFGDWKIGGNPLTIGFGHMLDFTVSALGDFVKGSTHSRTQIQWHENTVFDPETKEVVDRIKVDVPDLITVHGRLGSNPDHLTDDATLSIRFRRGQPFKGEPSLLWHINCEKGEIRLKSMTGTSLQASGYDVPPEIQIHHYKDESIEDVAWEWNEEQLEVPVPARGVMRCLYSFAEGTDEWATLEDAAHRAEQIEAWVKDGRW